MPYLDDKGECGCICHDGRDIDDIYTPHTLDYNCRPYYEGSAAWWHEWTGQGGRARGRGRGCPRSSCQQSTVNSQQSTINSQQS